MTFTGRPVIDLTGQRFGRLVVLARSDNLGQAVRWTCSCDCGSSSVVAGSDLKRKSRPTRSCGCLHAETWQRITKATKHGGVVGGRRSPTYRSWSGAKERCLNPKAINYANYGGRGISMAPEWVGDFGAFLEYMGERPEGTSLDRIDPDGNYAPGNVRWADRSTQRRNRRVDK